ncbi:hypothetical protein [Pedobacter sp. MW01-1-1]|uniref:hypothetical protein n=1 Tax=Pedobacter sp. MW01-1-1 TaxID=3383027 RepID=UPI003FF09A53
MRRILVLFVCLVGFFSADAQIYRNVDMGGDHLSIRAKKTDDSFEGSAYLFDDWRKAIVQFGAGTEPAAADIKYDLLEDVLVLKGKDEEEYQFSTPPTQFLITSTKELFKNGFAPIDKFTEKTFYKVIYDGKVKYLKKTSKQLIESKGYNSASVTKKVAEDTNYYLVTEDNKPKKVKNTEKALLAVLGKEDQLTKFIEANKLNVKSTDDLIKLFTYYDTL